MIFQKNGGGQIFFSKIGLTQSAKKHIEHCEKFDTPPILAKKNSPQGGGLRRHFRSPRRGWLERFFFVDAKRSRTFLCVEQNTLLKIGMCVKYSYSHFIQHYYTLPNWSRPKNSRSGLVMFSCFEKHLIYLHKFSQSS